MSHPPQQYSIMHRSSETDWTEFWFHQIGWVGYFFGQLEWTPYLLGDRVGCSKTQQRRMTKLSFAERCDFAKTNLLPKIIDLEIRKEWADVLDEVKKCGKMRNDILHNPLELNVQEMEAHGIRIDQGIRLLKKNGKILGLGDVQHFTRTMTELHRRVIDLLARTSV